MFKRDYEEFKSIYSKQIGKVVRAKVKDDHKGITDRLVGITDQFIELIHLDGRSTIVRIDEIVVLSLVPGKEKV